MYTDIESALKLNGGLNAPFKAERGIRQGCLLSGMLYSLALEPFLHKLRKDLTGFTIPGYHNSHFILSAYADDVMVFIRKQSDIDLLIANTNGQISSAKVNWGKSEALLVEIDKNSNLRG